MAIEPTQPARSQATEAARAASARQPVEQLPDGSAPPAVTPAGDVIDLSEAARLLAAARAASDATTPERAALLQELRARIEDGSYEPDAEAVARELVDRGEA